MSGQNGKIVVSPVIGRLTFVTVAFSGEVHNLVLQAKSLKAFGLGAVRHWVIVWNEPKNRIEKLRPQLEMVSAALAECPFSWEIIWRADLIDFDDPVGSGHRMQQILKLYVAQKVFTPHYVLLDTKNHLVRTLEVESLCIEAKPAAYLQNYREGDLFHRGFENARAIFGTTLSEKNVFQALPSTTPYMMYAEIVRAMLLELRIRAGKSWPDMILVKREDGSNTTEFALYNAFLEAKHLVSELYQFTNKKYALALFALSPKTEQEVLGVINQTALDAEVKFFGIHKARYKRLGEPERLSVARLWEQVGLFSSVQAGLEFLTQAASS